MLHEPKPQPHWVDGNRKMSTTTTTTTTTTAPQHPLPTTTLPLITTLKLHVTHSFKENKSLFVFENARRSC
jgi:hypothetical protein